jgi:hypothetical protein
MFEFQIVYVKPVLYNEHAYMFDPTVRVPAPEGTEHYGMTLVQINSLTDEDVKVIQTQAKWDQIRSYRDKELQASDWTQGADIPDSIKTPWAVYRNSLRNLPTDFATPEEVVLPTKPE